MLIIIPIGLIMRLCRKREDQQQVPAVYQVPMGPDGSRLISNEQLPDGAPPPYPGNQPMQPHYVRGGSKLSQGSKVLIAIGSVIVALIVIGIVSYFIWANYATSSYNDYTYTTWAYSTRDYYRETTTRPWRQFVRSTTRRPTWLPVRWNEPNLNFHRSTTRRPITWPTGWYDPPTTRNYFG